MIVPPCYNLRRNRLGRKTDLIDSLKSFVRIRQFGVVITVLVLTTLACQLDLGGPISEYSPLQMGLQDQGDLGETWLQAIESAAESGQVMVVINETQLSTFLADRLVSQGEPVLISPQVFLRDNVIQVFGTVEQGIFSADAQLTIAPVVQPDGTIQFELTQAEFGPVLAPDYLKDSISGVLTEALTGSLGSLATGVRLTSVAIDDGQMSIVGELR